MIIDHAVKRTRSSSVEGRQTSQTQWQVLHLNDMEHVWQIINPQYFLGSQQNLFSPSMAIR